MGFLSFSTKFADNAESLLDLFGSFAAADFVEIEATHKEERKRKVLCSPMIVSVARSYGIVSLDLAFSF